ncbi:ABC transporter, permease protein [Leptotrichia hofstadii F0254]|uniref:ABC transporter, permease protein n=1 Tax=Leptotrichia hofstadii F0254 TaxID=634994 RepID=C9MZL9_9FUSO|nr:ABC transporter, permease protein [Leptotrichia hofstadii F0254]
MNKLKKLKFIGKDTQLKIFLVLAIIVVLIAIFAPKIIPYSFDEEVGASLTAPNGKYFFGTDQIGRDLFSRVIYGARYSIFMTMTLVFIIFIVGTVLGVTAGYFGGIADSIIMRIGDMMIAFPGLILAIAIAGLLGPSVRNAIIAISAVTWTKYARLARSMVLKIKQELYVEAAKITGSRNYSVIFKYIIPNMITTMIVTAVSDMGTIMLEIAGLSFLGFGAQPPIPEWGAMLNEGRETYTQAPWTMIYPGLAIVIVVIIFNMLGDSVRDLVDVKSE